MQTGRDEVIVFAWIKWPDKQIHDVAIEQLSKLMKTDECLSFEINPIIGTDWQYTVLDVLSLGDGQ